MKRLLVSLRLELLLQLRYRLIAVAIAVGAISGFVLNRLFAAPQRDAVLPAVLLFVVGGTSLLYAAAQFIFERDEGTFAAVRVSPLRPAEYLGARLIALTLLMLLESVVILTVGAAWPAHSLPALIGGAVLIAVLHIAIGVLLIPSFAALTDALLPIAALVLVLQLPALLLFDGVPWFPLMLLPSSAPLLLLRAAWVPTALPELLLLTAVSVGWAVVLIRSAAVRLRRTVLDRG